MKSRFAVFSVIFALFSVFFVACSNAEPKDVAISFYKALEKGDEESAIKLVHIADESKRDEYEGKVAFFVAAFKSEAKKRGGIKNIEVVEEKIEGDKATIMLKTTYKKSDKADTEKPEKINLIKVDGAWKVDLGMDDLFKNMK